jgi:hypothetical protein
MQLSETLDGSAVTPMYVFKGVMNQSIEMRCPHIDEKTLSGSYQTTSPSDIGTFHLYHDDSLDIV